MTNNAYQELLPGNSDLTKTSLVSALSVRSIYVLTAGEDPQTIDLTTFLVICDADSGNLFLYDSTDTTTAHDGTSCQVDTNGRRYKIVSDLEYPYSVLDRLATPPGSPANGDAYIVIATATGDWAGQEDAIAVYTAQGWVFITPRAGLHVYVEDETAFYHYSAGGAWTSGLGSLSIAADAVTPVEALFWSIVSVEDTLNTPPGSPTDGQAYLVGTSASGAWVGQDNKVALRRSGAWEYVAPYEGARLYDKDANEYRTYEGSAWAADPTITLWEFIDEYDIDVSGSTDPIEFTGLENFYHIRVVVLGIQNAANLLPANLELSDDDGATWKTAAATYHQDDGTTTTPIGVISSAAGPRYGEIELWGFNSASDETQFRSSLGNDGWRNAEEVNNALRLNFTSNVPNAGKVRLWGQR